MVKPLPLDRLPKAGRIRSIRFRRTTPGNFTRLKYIQTASPADVLVDPSHPWAQSHPKTYKSKFPRYHTPFLDVHAVPKALLAQPETPLPAGRPFELAPLTPYGEDGRLVGGTRRLNMSLMHMVLKKSVHKQSVIRNKVKSKLKSAVGLIVTRDADVKVVNGKKRIVTTESDDGEKWVMQDWTYIFTPTLDVYRMPLHEILPGIREALSSINFKCRRLEEQWKKLQANRHAAYSLHRAAEAMASSSSPELKDKQQADKRTQPQIEVEGDDSKKKKEPTRPPTRIHVKALLMPYTSNAELIDDDLVIGEKEENQNDDGDVDDTDEEEEEAEEGAVSRKRNPASPKAKIESPKSSKYIQVQLPPRRSPPVSALKSRIDEATLQTMGTRLLSGPPVVLNSVPKNNKSFPIPATGDEKKKEKKEEGKEADTVKSVAETLFSKETILKPFDLPADKNRRRSPSRTRK